MEEPELRKCYSCSGPLLIENACSDVCAECYRDPATNNCEECGRHLDGINYPYFCGICIAKRLTVAGYKVTGYEAT